MAPSGSTLAAAACIAWALPISQPSAVTNEFSDMFWALNGAALTPCLTSHRQMPAAITLLPASDAVPATRIAFIDSGLLRGNHAPAGKGGGPCFRPSRRAATGA